MSHCSVLQAQGFEEGAKDREEVPSSVPAGRQYAGVTSLSDVEAPKPKCQQEPEIVNAHAPPQAKASAKTSRYTSLKEQGPLDQQPGPSTAPRWCTQVTHHALAREALVSCPPRGPCHAM